MMTYKQKEAAARKLCELRGIDPDDRVQHGADPDENGLIPAVALFSPAWKRALREIEAMETIQEAMQYGIDS